MYDAGSIILEKGCGVVVVVVVVMVEGEALILSQQKVRSPVEVQCQVVRPRPQRVTSLVSHTVCSHYDYMYIMTNVCIHSCLLSFYSRHSTHK